MVQEPKESEASALEVEEDRLSWEVKVSHDNEHPEVAESRLVGPEAQPPASAPADSDDEEFTSEEGWMVRWADDEGKPLLEFFDLDADTPRLPTHNNQEGASLAPRGILVGKSPGPQSIDWGALFNMWDYDENPWTPTYSTLVGHRSKFQETKRTFSPKLIYGMVFVVMVVAALVGPMAAAKKAQILAKRRKVAESKKQVAKTAERVAVLRDYNANSAAANAALAANITSQKECLASLSDLKGAMYPSQAGTNQKPGPLTQKSVTFGPDWGLFEHPVEVRLRMLREWGDVPSFLTLELGRVIKTLEVQLRALDARRESTGNHAGGPTSLPVTGYMPITDSPEECRRFLDSAKTVFSAFQLAKREAYSEYSIQRARQLVLYGLLLQRRQELKRAAAYHQQKAEDLQIQDAAIHQLRQKRREVERSVTRYLRVAREVLDIQADNKAIPAAFAQQFDTFVQSFKLQDLAAFANTVRRLQDKDAAQKLASPISEWLDAMSTWLPQMVNQEAALVSQLGGLQAAGSPEQQQAAESMSAACERIGVERDSLIETLSTVLSDVTLIAVKDAMRLHKIKKIKDSAANALDAINGMKPLIASAKKAAIQGVV